MVVLVGRLANDHRRLGIFKQGREIKLIMHCRKLLCISFHALFSFIQCVIGEIYRFELHTGRDTVCNAVEQSLIVAVHYDYLRYRKKCYFVVCKSNETLALGLADTVK